MPVQRRRIIREKVLQSLYAYEISKEPIVIIQEQQLTELKADPNEFKFAKTLIDHVVQHEDDLDVIIRSKVANWEFERVAVIDKIILRIGIAELLYFDDIPPKVTINEAIEISKIFSTERSGHFIIGVLDSVLNDLRKKNTLHKSGRGLLDQSPFHVSKDPTDKVPGSGA
jgi:N utilization substance protein B